MLKNLKSIKTIQWTTNQQNTRNISFIANKIMTRILYMFQNIETKNPLEIKHNVNSIQNNDCKNFNIDKLFITLNLSPIALNLSPIALILSPIALILS